MTSTSQLGSTGFVLQFDLNRNIDAAGRERGRRPSTAARSHCRPTSRGIRLSQGKSGGRPDSDPVPHLGHYYSGRHVRRRELDSCPKVGQISGVGQFFVGGGANPGGTGRGESQPVEQFGIGIDAVRTVLGAANANRPKGALANDADA